MSQDLLKLYIEPTSRCNFSCTMCFRNTWFDEKFADMPYETFMRTMDTMPDTVQTVFFGGMGEPLIHPDIYNMVAEAHDRGKRTELITNGTLLTERNIRRLMDAGIDMLWVSIDSFEDEKYDKIQQNGNFTVIKNNLNTLNNLRTKYTVYGSRIEIGRPALGVTFVAMKSNVQYLSLVSDFALRYHVQEVNISNVLPSDEETEKEILYEDLVNNAMRIEGSPNTLPNISLPMMDFAVPEAQVALTSIIGSHLSNLSISGAKIERKARYCRFVEEGNCFVRYDGNVAPCMGVLHNSYTYLWHQKRKIYHHSFGNMTKGDLTEIWNSAEYTDFRQRVLDFSFSPCVFCGGCDNREENQQDCFGNEGPTCGACLWAEGIIKCP